MAYGVTRRNGGSDRGSRPPVRIRDVALHRSGARAGCVHGSWWAILVVGCRTAASGWSRAAGRAARRSTGGRPSRRRLVVRENRGSAAGACAARRRAREQATESMAQVAPTALPGDPGNRRKHPAGAAEDRPCLVASPSRAGHGRAGHRHRGCGPASGGRSRVKPWPGLRNERKRVLSSGPELRRNPQRPKARPWSGSRPATCGAEIRARGLYARI